MTSIIEYSHDIWGRYYLTENESEAEAFAWFYGVSYQRVTGFPNDYFKITIR